MYRVIWMDHFNLVKKSANKPSISAYFDKWNVHHDATAFFVDFLATQTTL